eukprot:3208844-Amphidinium_carterae.1
MAPPKIVMLDKAMACLGLNLRTSNHSRYHDLKYEPLYLKAYDKNGVMLVFGRPTSLALYSGA